MVAVNPNINGAETYAQLKKERSQLELKMMLNSLAIEFKGTKNQQQRASLKSQIEGLVKTLDNGQTFKDITGQDLNANGKNQGGIPGVNGGIAVNGKGKPDKYGRTVEQKKQERAVIKELKKEFNVASSKDGDWIKLAKENNNVTVYDKDGNEKTEFNRTFTNKKTGEQWEAFNSKDVIEIKSEKYGTVKIQAGGDGYLNGGDDKILSMGGQSAASSMQTGLNHINKAGCPACGGAGCPACSGKTAGVAEAKAVTAAPQIANLATANPQMAQMVDQVQDPYQLSESNIKDLLAAIMLLVNKQSA